MTPSDLRERVAKFFCSAAEGRRFGCGTPACWCFTQADAAIAIVLEEAAKVAADSWNIPNTQYYTDELEQHARGACLIAAVAIRALGKS